MRLLLVDDNRALAEVTADLLMCMDQPMQRIEKITLAGNLQSALQLLPHYDAVLCDGEFPVSPDAKSSGEEWAAVFRESCRHRVNFILYSGSPLCLEDARYCNIPAISKPSSVEAIYAAISEYFTPNDQLQQPLYQPVSERILQRGGHA